MTLRVLLAVGFIWALLPGPAKAQPTYPTANAMFTTLSAETPGLAVLVARGGKIIFQRTAGAADIEQRTAITPQTRFHVASVSKQFTAAAVLLLARDGKLRLDAPARHYLPSLPQAYAAVTVRQLLNHSGGLRDQWELALASDASISDLLRQDRLLALIEAQRSLNFVPGSEFRYSNSGYLVAAEIVTRVAEVPFARFVEKRLFRPLGMKDTLVYDDASVPIIGRAQSYATDGAGRVRLSRLNFSNYGATSVFTTLADLHHWSRELLNPKVMDVSLLKEMAQTTRLSDGSVSPYGLGLNQLAVRGHNAVMHTGSDAGFRALFAIYPREDTTMLILSNGSDDVSALHETLVDAFMNDRESANEIPPPGLTRLAALTGYYVSTWGPGFELQLKDGKLVRPIADGPPQTASFHTDGTIRFLGLRLRPGRTGVLEDNPVIGPPLAYRRVQRAVPSQAALIADVGRYRSDELDNTLSVALNGGRLTLSSLRSPRSKTLVPAEAGWFDLPSAHVRFDHGDDGKARALLLTMSRSREMRFERED